MTSNSHPAVEQKKCIIVVQETLPLGLIANTAAVVALTLGGRLDLLGPDLKDGSGEVHAGLTTIPVPILKASAETIASIRQRASAIDDLFVVDVTDAAQTTTNYADYEEKLGSRSSEELMYLGIGLYGDRRAINRLTGNLALLR